ncbi:GNAT family N-acetyltransferase [Flavobacterium sp.]|uniref:GNAT family N-acetyltransferase n=1 Tax=Flavobacterium sp. TaxID=239 RepID=UPI002BAF1E7E|nr:GNAT family N-acetyltransferase [Flavobacterium sp.]HSD06839.1 GNAT family N-acetyltransferase [Flavobacterium sp.]
MITISEATFADIKIIQDIAYQTWPIAYGEILSKQQLDYMLDAFYNEQTIKDSIINNGNHFILAKENENVLGFASFEHSYNQKQQTKIHKIYVLPETQGKGIGKKLIDFIEIAAKKNDFTSLLLNVNRFNKALFFYQKLGFEIISEIDIEIGNGYLMEDFILAKQI